MLNEFETLKEGNILPGVEAMDLSAPSENTAAVLYDNDELLQDDKPFSDYNALEADSKTKRAWEVVNWRKPKRAWEMIKLGPNGWTRTGKRSDETMVDIPVQHADSDPWMIDEIGYDGSEYDNNGYDIGNYDKKSWEPVPETLPCPCCTPKVASKCCHACTALTTYKRNYNNGDNETIKSIFCRCCQSIWRKTNECCTVCKIMS